MNMRTLIGVAGAAALAFGSAHAVKIDGEFSVTYAKETITKVSERSVTGSGKFYDLAPDHEISGMADITANDEDTAMYEVLFTLQSMVFAGDATLTDSALTRTAAPTTDAPTPQENADWFTLSRGGAPGDNFVLFTKATGAEAIGAKDMLTLTAKFAVTADGPGGITRVVTNKALPTAVGLAVTMTHTNPDAVKVARALKETVIPADPTPKADAGDDFMSFTGGTAQSPRLYASLGTVMVGVKSGIRDARVAEDDATNQDPTNIDDRLVTLEGLDGAAENDGIIAPGVLDDASDTAGSVATFSGAFDFLETLALVEVDCSGSLTELRKPSEDDRTILTDETMPMQAGEFATEMTLCVAVDGETAIPRTGVYMVTTEYKGPTENMFPPVGATHNLAAIGRSGSTFRIPFLTVKEAHNQRLNIVNRGAATTYTLGELATIGDSVNALPAASGELPQGQMVLKVSDIIEVMGAMRASGTLSMPAPASSIDVSIDIVNRDNGTIDTVYVDAE